VKNGWRTKKLGEVATLQRGFDLPASDRIGGNFPLVSSSGISDTHHKGPVRGPGVVTGRSGSIGNVFFIENDFWPLNTVLYVKNFHGNDPRFVFRLLENFDLKRYATGSGVPTLNRNFVHDELVNIPSLREQQRIARILDEAFDDIAAAKANAEKNLENARSLFESHLQAVFTQHEKRWPLKKLDVLCDKITDGTHNSPPYVESGIPMLDSKHVRDDFVIDDTEPEKFITRETDKLLAKRCKPRTGDILISSRGTIGKIAIVREGQDFNIMGNMILIRLASGISREFVAFYLLSMVRHIESISRGVAQKGLYLSQMREYELPLAPASRQVEIAKQLKLLSVEIQRLEALYQHKLNLLGSLKKSLLQQAFTGQF